MFCLFFRQKFRNQTFAEKYGLLGYAFTIFHRMSGDRSARSCRKSPAKRLCHTQLTHCEPSPTSSLPIACCPVERGQRLSSAHCVVNTEFLHIIFRCQGEDIFAVGPRQKKPMLTCETVDGSYSTKWALHFYPDGHPSNYTHPDMEWFPTRYIPDDQKFASLYVRLKEGPHEMVEARMMTTVLNGDSDIDSAVGTNMERFMQCPRMKVLTYFSTQNKNHVPNIVYYFCKLLIKFFCVVQVDEFYKEAAGHGWPKLFSTASLKGFSAGFTCVVSLQILQPGTLSGVALSLRRPSRICFNLRDNLVRSCAVMVTLRYTLNHHSNHDAVLQSLDWQHVKAHRFVLAAKSGLFRRLLRKDQGQPFIYKCDLSIRQLHLLLDLLYLDRLPSRTRSATVELHQLAKEFELCTVVRALERDLSLFNPPPVIRSLCRITKPLLSSSLIVRKKRTKHNAVQKLDNKTEST